MINTCAMSRCYLLIRNRWPNMWWCSATQYAGGQIGPTMKLVRDAEGYSYGWLRKHFYFIRVQCSTFDLTQCFVIATWLTTPSWHTPILLFLYTNFSISTIHETYAALESKDNLCQHHLYTRMPILNLWRSSRALSLPALNKSTNSYRKTITHI